MSRLLVCLTLAALVGGCASSKTPAAKSPALLPAGAAPGAQVESDAPIPPKDAQWTIYCQTVTGPNHVLLAKQLKSEVLRASGMNNFYLLHGENESTLYYGFYRAINDARDSAETTRARNDLQKIDAMKDSVGRDRFPNRLFVELAAPDPGGPPEWNLARTPAGAYWSLQIAAYKDSPDRKRYAVEAVKEARARGLEAYYYHGPTVSSVCIGAWPREAVREQESADASSSDPSQPLLVLSKPLPPGANQDIRDPSGRRVKAMAPRAEPVDPAMIDLMKQYPTHSVNGVVMVKKYRDSSGKLHEQPDPSFLVVIPHEDFSATPPVGAAPRPAPPARRPATPGGGMLRSIGE